MRFTVPYCSLLPPREDIGGTTYGLGNPNVDGFYLDDDWNYQNRPNKLPSPSEEAWPCTPRGTGAGRCSGFDKSELFRISKAWQTNMDAVETAIVEKKGFAVSNLSSKEATVCILLPLCRTLLVQLYCGSCPGRYNTPRPHRHARSSCFWPTRVLHTRLLLTLPRVEETNGWPPPRAPSLPRTTLRFRYSGKTSK